MPNVVHGATRFPLWSPCALYLTHPPKMAFFTKRSSVHKDYLTSFELALIDANGRSQSDVSIKILSSRGKIVST